MGYVLFIHMFMKHLPKFLFFFYTREEKDQFTNLVPMNAFDFIYHIIHYIDGTNKDIVTEVKKWFIIFDIYES